MIEDGEIPFLDADPLTHNIRAEEKEAAQNEDDVAIERIRNRLRSQGGRSEEQLEEISVDLYNKICEGIRSGVSSRKQIEEAALLFGEDPEDLLHRLRS